MRWPATRPESGERGDGPMFLLVAVAALIAAVGLVVDGGGRMYKADEVRYAAQQAARVAGQYLDGSAVLAGGAPTLDQAAAVRAGRDALAVAGVDGTVTVESGDVVVRTTGVYRPVFLVFLGDLGVSASARASAVTG